MRFKLILLKIILSLFFISSNAIAKNLPPGSGISDVPANVLILLDKSGSMSARMTGGASTQYPVAVAYDNNGDVFIGSNTDGIKKFDYSTNTLDANWASSGSHMSWTTSNCYSYYIRGMAYHGGYIYVASFYSSYIYRLDVTTGACDMMNNRIYHRYPRALDIRNNKLYVVGNDGTGVYDLSQSTFPRIQNYNSQNYARYTEVMTTDQSGSHIYWYYNNRIYTHKLNANGTINTNVFAQPVYSSLGFVRQVDAHPTDDNVQYVSRWNNHALTKITFTSSNKQAFRQTKTVGRCCNGTSNASTQYFYYPWAVSVDTTNNRVMGSSFTVSTNTNKNPARILSLT